MKKNCKKGCKSSKKEEYYVPPPAVLQSESSIFRGEWDAEGVYFYQAFRPEIAEWALENQRFGGPYWKPTRMTWIKPSFAWMLYRSGYGRRPGQTRVLKVKLSHQTVAHLLSYCRCNGTNKETKMKRQTNEETGYGMVQWDPERDLFAAEGHSPRRLLHTRSIQIGLARKLSEFYVDNIISIQDVTELAHQVGVAHRLKGDKATFLAMEAIQARLPEERPYLPGIIRSKLQELAMLPGPAADMVQQIGRGYIKQIPSGSAFCTLLAKPFLCLNVRLFENILSVFQEILLS